jgi:hypothetical protein
MTAFVELQKQHHWLQKLVGEWTYEGEALSGPGKPAEKFTGAETVRTLGGAWVVCEGQGEIPGGGTASSLLTLGYDTKQQRFVGTWVGSMMDRLWVYDEGFLDADEKTLTLGAEGPDFEAEGKTAKYRDVIELKSDDHRTLSAWVLGKDGQWTSFMTTHYRRR